MRLDSGGIVRAGRRLGYRVAWFGMRGWWRVVHPVSIGVRVMITDGERILLVRHTYRGGWFMPGGGVHRHETLDAAARREAFEETGVRVRDVRLLGIYSNFGESKSDHVALFVSTEFGPLGNHDEEIAEVEWFPMDALPEDVSQGTAQRITDFRGGAPGIVGHW
jgi:8-oxo-dGTP pyrophosphatase MutT (NUDIX family)